MPTWLCLELQGLDSLHKLQLLELGDNRLATIEGLGALRQLQELWLGRNRITHVSNLDGCVSHSFKEQKVNCVGHQHSWHQHWALGSQFSRDSQGMKFLLLQLRPASRRTCCAQQHTWSRVFSDLGAVSPFHIASLRGLYWHPSSCRVY